MKDSDGESAHDDLMSLIMSILFFIWEFNLSKDKGCTDNDVENIFAHHMTIYHLVMKYIKFGSF